MVIRLHGFGGRRAKLVGGAEARQRSEDRTARKVDVEMLGRFYAELRKRGGRGGRPKRIVLIPEDREDDDPVEMPYNARECMPIRGPRGPYEQCEAVVEGRRCTR